ncbi:hypothetical protein ABZ901_04075 [Actinacidiphila alni]|uniref:hypothetical protein n=1 Tax=Actinacidiphila alni TaxID=380248 RepID=UPI0033FE3B63
MDMEWVDETGRHTGYVAAVLADGAEPPRVAAGADDSGRRKPWWSYNGADGPRAVGVRGACVCGWRGTETHPITRGDDEATEGAAARTGPYADWEYHVTATEGAIPYDVEQMLTALRARIEDLSRHQPVMALRAAARLEESAPAHTRTAVRAARRALVSWDTIARTLGESPVTAQARFGDGPDDV